MPSVGSVTCKFVKGTFGSPRTRVVTWENPGMDGINWLTLGSAPGSFTLAAVLFGSAVNVTVFFRALEALSGTEVTIVDDWNASYANCLIQELREPRMTSQYDPANPTETARGEMIITGRITG